MCSSLNHPNTAAIYDLQEANGSRFLVLELVEGETLAERIKRGPIPVDESLNIAKNICEALEAAHEKGVVHRDLKTSQREDHARWQGQGAGLRTGEGVRGGSIEGQSIAITDAEYGRNERGSDSGDGGVRCRRGLYDCWRKTNTEC